MSDAPEKSDWRHRLTFLPEDDSEPVCLADLFERASRHTYERDGDRVPIPPAPRMVFGLFDHQPMRQRYRCKTCGHTHHRAGGDLLWLYGVPVKCEPITE